MTGFWAALASGAALILFALKWWRSGEEKRKAAERLKRHAEIQKEVHTGNLDALAARVERLREQNRIRQRQQPSDSD